MDPPAQKIVYDSPLHEEPEEEAVEENSMMSKSPSLRNAASPSPPPTPSQKVDYRSDPISPEDRDENAGADESQDTRPHASPKEISQHPPLDAGEDHSESDLLSPDNLDWSAEMDGSTSATSHTSSRGISPVPPPHIDYDNSGSHTNLQETPSGGDALGGGAGDEGSGELSVRNLVFSVAEIGVGSDDSDEEDDLSETQQDDSEASGTLLFSTLPIRTLHGRRFSSEFRWEIPPRW